MIVSCSPNVKGYILSDVCLMCSLKFKAALISNFTLTLDQITLCNVKVVAHSDEPAQNCHTALQFPSAVQSFSVF